MNNFYKEKVAFDIMFGSILKEDNTNNLFYNCRKLDKTFYIPAELDNKELKDIMRKSLLSHHDYLYDMVKENPVNQVIMGFIY